MRQGQVEVFPQPQVPPEAVTAAPSLLSVSTPTPISLTCEVTDGLLGGAHLLC